MQSSASKKATTCLVVFHCAYGKCGGFLHSIFANLTYLSLFRRVGLALWFGNWHSNKEKDLTMEVLKGSCLWQGETRSRGWIQIHGQLSLLWMPQILDPITRQQVALHWINWLWLRERNTSKPIRRAPIPNSFCRHCGSSLYSKKNNGIVNVRLGILDVPSHSQASIFLSHPKRQRNGITDDLKQFEAEPSYKRVWGERRTKSESI